MSELFSANAPIYIQIMDKIKKQVVAGELKPGERLASVRDLALTFSVNPNTMQRALMELETEGFVYAERTSGRFVTDDTELIKRARDDLAGQYTKQYIVNMKAVGYEAGQILEKLQNQLQDEKGANSHV